MVFEETVDTTVPDHMPCPLPFLDALKEQAIKYDHILKDPLHPERYFKTTYLRTDRLGTVTLVQMRMGLLREWGNLL